MTEKKKHEFHKSVQMDINPQFDRNKQIHIQRQKTIYALIKKYNLSEQEAEEKLIEIEKRVLSERRKEQQLSKPKKRNIEKNRKLELMREIDSDENVIVPQHVINREEDTIINHKQAPIPKNQSKHDVDSILEDIIPDYNKQISVELDHANLTFDVQEDRIDNLKEKVIRTLKRDIPEVTKFHVLNDITFKIYQGEKVGIIGYNGAGKSTLLNLITGIYKPDSGTVKTYGKISPLLSLGAGFDYNYSGARNIYLNGAVLGYSKDFIEEKYDEIVEFADLGKFIDLPIKNYSSGMLAKLGFSIATIVDPDILIIDEILGVGDVNFQKKSHDKMNTLMDGHTTVLLVSHSVPTIRQLCDKAIWIDKGMVREIGEVNKVCDHYLKDAEKATRDQLKDIQFR